MKRKTVLISVVAAFLMAGISSCQQEEKKKPEKSQAEMQEEFEQNLASYPAQPPELGTEILRNYNFDEKSRPGKITLEKGMEIAYVHGGDTLSGKLPQDIVCLYKDGKTVMANCSEVIAHGKASLLRFPIGPYKDGPWSKSELTPDARKYQLSIAMYPDSAGHTGPTFKTYESFKDVSTIGNPQFQVLDVLKERVENNDERLKTFLEFKGERFLYRADGKEWGQR